MLFKRRKDATKHLDHDWAVQRAATLTKTKKGGWLKWGTRGKLQVRELQSRRNLRSLGLRVTCCPKLVKQIIQKAAKHSNKNSSVNYPLVN